MQTNAKGRSISLETGASLRRHFLKEGSWGAWGRNNAAYIALVLLIVVFWAVAGQKFLSFRNWVYIAQEVPVLAILAIAETLVITAGFIDLSVGSVLGLSSYAAAVGASAIGIPGLALGLLVGLLTGLLNGAIFSYIRIPSFIVTLGTMVILRAAIQIISGGEAIYLSDSSANGATAFLNAVGQFPGIIIVGFVVWLASWVIYTKTTFGDDLRAIGGNERVVGLFGVNLNSRRLMVFSTAGLFVGIASLVNLARIGAATPVTGTGMELEAISAVVLGGTPLTGGYGSIAKTVVGATALVVLSNGLTIAGIPPSWNDAVRGLLLIVAIGIALDRRKIAVVK
jgi:ribose/xylose/arabinose/galactoside ABC-type transport system permease subunit